jgi:hypothetical protein
MFNNKRITELENSVKALTALVDRVHDKQNENITLPYSVARVEREIYALEKYFGLEVVTYPTTLSYQKIKKEKK